MMGLPARSLLSAQQPENMSLAPYVYIKPLRTDELSMCRLYKRLTSIGQHLFYNIDN